MIVNLQDSTSVEAMRLYCESKVAEGLRVGLTSGCFDLFHYYHLIYLERCKRKCSPLIVGVDSDRFVRKSKGKDRPIINEHHRLALVDGCMYTDFVFVMDGLRDWEQMCIILGDTLGIVFKNDPFKDIVHQIPGITDKVKVTIVPDVEQLQSTSQTIKKIEKGISL